MALFDNVLKSNQTLVKNVDALDYEFLPKILPFRKVQQEYLATCIKPLFNGLNGKNLFIYGFPDKVNAVRSVLRDLEQQTDKIEVFFINCWQNNTTYKIMLEMCDILGYKYTQNKKIVELFKVVSSILNRKAAVFVFDEIDQVEDFDFLYFILAEIHKKSIFLISNYAEFLVEIDERIKSKLLPEMLEFKPYNEGEIKDILIERLSIAFYPDVWQNDAVELVAKKAAELSDIRVGIFLLKEATLLTEEKKLRRITKDQVLNAIMNFEKFSINNAGLQEEETKIIYVLIKENSGKAIGGLFKLYQNQGGTSSFKTFKRKISKLEEERLIQTSKLAGIGGNTNIVKKIEKQTNMSVIFQLFF